MKRLLLGSLMSCMLVGQVSCAADEARQGYFTRFKTAVGLGISALFASFIAKEEAMSRWQKYYDECDLNKHSRNEVYDSFADPYTPELLWSMNDKGIREKRLLWRAGRMQIGSAFGKAAAAGCLLYGGYNLYKGLTHSNALISNNLNRVEEA